ncbi:RepA protein [Marinobacter pelagius]|jgi:hypothetical protein|uniref:RepA protein n=2 Tax=Marinobacter TaxID=2742 RepID=A0A368UN26_MARNT|nr:RepA protein [Marinobacter pelagius]RBP68694.1 RepA protein [Marinobacter nauticus]RCW30169.1 RepA protein [Marinobacter nauticus]
MQHFDAQAYAKRLVEKGIDPDTAADLARKTAESQRQSDRQPTFKKAAATAEQTATGLALEATSQPKEPATPPPADETRPPAKRTRKKAPAKKEAQDADLASKKGTLTKRERELVNTGLRIAENEPDNDDLTFMHSIMCQVGLPRSKVDGFEFERVCGGAGLYVRAGKLWDGQQFVQQPLPYGPMPRLVMAHLNTEALRQKSPEIEVGNSAADFLKRLGKESSGGRTGTYTTFRKQIQALSACSMTLGFTTATTAITYDGKPIKQFEAWLANSEEQGTLWPGTITFSQEYYQTLTGHAVPLDLRAMHALTGSALAMDIYAMLADRLHRISGRPLILHWRNLREQFGQEYSGPEADKNFKKKFLPALQKALTVYPQAKVKKVAGGILMMPSPPPIPYRG